MISIIIIALLGLIISIYGIMVEYKIKQNGDYTAICDISDKISCTRPFLSPYKKMLGISNIWASAMYYGILFILALFHLKTTIFIITCIGIVVSIIFAYILFFKMRLICLICVSLYIINIALAVSCYLS